MSKLKFKLGKLTIDAQAYGSQGNAILGIRDSGKTYTATEIAEKLFEAGIPFITFDPTGVWRYLRVPGKGRGYPIVVAGGKDGDLPLTVSGATEIVRAAMKNGVSLVIDLTDPKLSKADWRRIVKACVIVLLQENAPHGLRHIFLEEAAEFIPQKVIDGDLYAEVEKLARIGGNARLGYTIINQRSQEVAKAVLELCENLFLHRQKGKNAIENMDKWLDIADVAERREIVQSLPRLPSGHCWAWMGGNEDIPTLIEVPPKNSFHPDRRVMHGTKTLRGKKKVDVKGFVAGMKTALVSLEAEFKQNDVPTLRAEIAKLKAELAKKPAVQTVTAADPKAVAEAEARGYARGKIEGFAQGVNEVTDAWRDLAGGVVTSFKMATTTLETADKRMQAVLERATKKHVKEAAKLAAKLPGLPAGNGHFPAPAPTRAPPSPARAPSPAPAGGDGSSGDGTLTPMKQAILNAVAWIDSIGTKEATKTMVAFLANSSPKSSTFDKYMSQLKAAGLIVSPKKDRFSITNEGRAQADPGAGASDHKTLMENIGKKLTPGQMNILNAIVAVYPNQIEKNDIAAGANQSATSSTFDKYLSQVKSLGLVEQPVKAGPYVASANLFP